MTSFSRGSACFAAAFALLLCAGGCESVLFLTQDRVESVERKSEKTVSSAMSCDFIPVPPEAPAMIALVPVRVETVEFFERETVRRWGYSMPADPMVKSAEIAALPFVLAGQGVWTVASFILDFGESESTDLDVIYGVPEGFDREDFEWEEKSRAVEAMGNAPAWTLRTWRFLWTFFGAQLFPFDPSGAEMGPVSDPEKGPWRQARRTRRERVQAALASVRVDGKDAAPALKDGRLDIEAAARLMSGTGRIEVEFKGADGGLFKAETVMSPGQAAALLRVKSLSMAADRGGPGGRAESAALLARWGSIEEAHAALDSSIEAAADRAETGGAAEAFYKALCERFAGDPAIRIRASIAGDLHGEIIGGLCETWPAWRVENRRDLLFLHVASPSPAGRARGIAALALRGKEDPGPRRALLVGLLGLERDFLPAWAALWSLGRFQDADTESALLHYAGTCRDPILRGRAVASLRQVQARMGRAGAAGGE